MTKFCRGFCLCFAVAACPLLSREVNAQGVSTTGKGVVGGAMLGAELVVIGEAIAGVDEEWMYWAGAGLGAAGGATGGYFLEPYMSPQVSVLVLMGGMALSLPALIIALDANRRHWPEPAEPALPREPSSNPPDPASSPELVFQGPPLDAGALVHFSSNQIAWGVPGVYLTDTYTPWERWAYALPQGTNYQVPVLSARF